MKNKHFKNLISFYLDHSILKNHGFSEMEIWADNHTLHLPYQRKRGRCTDFLKYSFSLDAKKNIRLNQIHKCVILPEVNQILNAAGFTPRPVFSAGVSARINVFNALIIEPFYAFSLQKETHGVFGLNFTPGW